MSLLSSSSPQTGIIEEHEPFNHKLFEKAKDNARQEEDLIEEIARLRRNVPPAVVEKNKKRFKEEGEADDEGLKTLEIKMSDAEKDRRIGGTVLGIGRLERQDAVEQNWGQGIKGLERVLATLPEVVARCERASKAEEYVNGMHGK
jgi:kinetochor protein Mis14/NSL1